MIASSLWLCPQLKHSGILIGLAQFPALCYLTWSASPFLFRTVMSLPPSHGQSSVQKYTPNGLLLTESDEEILEAHDNYFDRGTFPDSACAASSAPSGSTIPSSTSNQAAADSDEDLLEAAEAHAAKQRYHNFAPEAAETIRSPPRARLLQFDDAAESLSVEEWIRFTAGVVPVSERTSLLDQIWCLSQCARSI